MEVKVVSVDEFERLQLRVRRLELRAAKPDNDAFREQFTRTGEAAQAERERLEVLRFREMKRREELAAVNERLARWGL